MSLLLKFALQKVKDCQEWSWWSFVTRDEGRKCEREERRGHVRELFKKFQNFLNIIIFIIHHCLRMSWCMLFLPTNLYLIIHLNFHYVKQWSNVILSHEHVLSSSYPFVFTQFGYINFTVKPVASMELIVLSQTDTCQEDGVKRISKEEIRLSEDEAPHLHKWLVEGWLMLNLNWKLHLLW